MTVLVTSALPSAEATPLFRFENRRENVAHWRLVPEFWSMSSNANYDGLGESSAVPGLTSYSKTNLDLTAIYGYSSDLSFFARLSMTSVSFQTTTPLTGKGSGLSEQGLGANYRVWESDAQSGLLSRTTSIDAQVSLDIPLYDNVGARTSSPRQPLLGDGSLDITLGGFATHPLNQGLGQRFYAIAGLGLVLRGSNYSKALPYQLQVVGLPEQKGFLYRFGLHGFKSMSSDPNGVTALSPQARLPGGGLDTRDAGGSLIVDALNSSYQQIRATVGYQWGVGDQIFLTYLMPLSGTSTAVIKGLVLGAQLRFGGSVMPSSPSSAAQTSSAASPSAAKPKLSYDLEGRVKQANDKLNLVKIDKGVNDGVEKGQIFDIYRLAADGRPADLVARGVVTGVNDSEAVVNLRQYKKEVWVQAGFIARRIKKQ